MKALPPGGELEATKQEIEAVGVRRSRRIGVRVERTLGHRKPHDEQEVGVVCPERPLAQPTLMRRRQVRLRQYVRAELASEQLQGLGEVKLRKRDRHRDR